MPLLSLTLVLERQPTPGEIDLSPLIRLGVFSLGLTLDVPADAVSAARLPGERLSPLFASNVRFRLRAPEGSFAEGAARGADAEVALGGCLDRSHTLAFLAALDGGSELTANASVSYRGDSSPEKIRLSGRWASIHDTLMGSADDDGSLSSIELRSAYQDAQRAGVLTVEREGSWDEVDSQFDDGPGFSAFMRAAAWLLRPTDAARWVLGKRPPASMPLDMTVSVEASATEHVELSAPLGELLGGCLEGLERARFIRLVGAEAASGDIRPTPPLVRSTSHARGADRSSPEISLRATATDLRSLTLALVPDRNDVPRADAFRASDVALSRIGSGHIASFLADDVVIPIDGDEQLQALPVVDNAGAVLWPDRLEPSARWYAPEFGLTAPKPSDDPATSSFLFAFARAGVTAGADPKPGLDGSILFRLTKVIPDPVRTAMHDAGDPSARPVPTGSLSVSLELPFRDAGGSSQTQLFPASVEETGDTVTARVDLIDDWVRLSYGALAYAGFQAQPPRLRITYAYRVYAPVDDAPVHLAYGGKLQILAAHTLLTADRGVARGVPLAAVRLSPVAVGAVSTAASTPIAVVRPEFTVTPIVAAAVAARTYATRTAIHEETHDVVLPCAELGAFYVSRESDGDTMVGCQDALRLGQIAYRQHEEVHELATDRYRVFRSLQQPGRFLVLPAAYRISRYGPAEPPDKAFRPAIMLYATFDTQGVGGKYFLSATLQPDVAPFERLELLDLLAPFTPVGKEPVLYHPTDPAVQAVAAFRWGLPDGIAEPTVRQVWDSLQVTVSAELADALTLTNLIEHGGLNGDITFELPDGQALTSGLTLDTRLIGPWASGPLDVAMTSTGVSLTNRVERPVHVADLLIRGKGGPLREIPADVSIEPGNSAQIAVTTLPGEVACPSYAEAGGALTLEQCNVFVEDVAATVTFLNLIDYATHALASLLIHVRRRDTDHVQDVVIAEGGSATTEIVFPITAYLHDRRIEVQIDKTDTQAHVTSTPWISFDLSEGVVLSLDWKLIA
jgi:hypothetical protein